jgi:hypothetical protein
MGKRCERPAARFVVVARQSAKAVRIVTEMDMPNALSLCDGLSATRASRPARLILSAHSIQRHETFPRKTPQKVSALHRIPRASKLNLVAGCGQRRHIWEEMGKAAAILLGGTHALPP